MPNPRTLLTIDCDWAVTPTPLRDGPNSTLVSDEPEVTFEHVRYAFRERPDDGRHGMCTSPAELHTALRTTGLPRTRGAILTETHDGVAQAWDGVLDEVQHIVCLDAHLDMYAVGDLTATLRGPGGARLNVHYSPSYREMGAGLPSLRHLGPAAVERAFAGTWEEAWALHLLERMPRLERFTWVVPDHFGIGLAQGFPYPHARWLHTLQEAAAHGIWSFVLEPAARRIRLEFLEPELAGRSLTVDIATLADCPPLDAVDADHVHLCRSPGFLHPAADGWVNELAERLG